jgi:hypothetical protein
MRNLDVAVWSKKSDVYGLGKLLRPGNGWRLLSLDTQVETISSHARLEADEYS